MSIVFALLASVVVMSISAPSALGTNSSGSVLEIQVAGQGSIPSDATSAVLNIASARASADGFVVAWPCGSPRPDTASLNYRKGQPISNATIIAIGDGGKICLANSTDTDLIVDANAALTATTGVVTANPIRIHDTRDSSPNEAGATLEIQVSGRNNVPEDSEAAVLNIAAARGANNGFVTAWPCGDPRPTASSLNYRAGEAVSNATIIAIGDGGKICLSSSTSADLVVDLNGIVSGNADFAGGAPIRLLDTRGGNPNGAGATHEVAIAGAGIAPANATAAVINIAATNATAAGFVTAWPCGTPRPNAASLNYGTAGAISNSTTVGIGDDGKICLFTSTSADLVVDVNGAFEGDDLATFPPVRLEDTRITDTSGGGGDGDTTTTGGDGDTTTTGGGGGGDTTTTGGGGDTTTPTPSGTQFFESFDGNTGLDRFRTGLFHRDDTVITQHSWQGDHDLDCNAPPTERTIDRNDIDGWRYLCKDHLMTSIGDTSGYSVGWFSPDQVFDSITEVCWDVNLTDLGSRQWWKVAVLSTSAPDIMSEVAASELSDLNGSDRAIASYGGVGGWKGKMRIGDERQDWFGMDSGDDKKTRYPACFRDNGNGTLTFTMTGPKDGGAVSTESFTSAGSFPDGPLKVVFQDHNYTPTKSDNGVGTPVGFTWHWDNIIIS
ncbi:hypothetical protein [Ilumatobacter coccineus]|uniref:hypothetical protein n=1 Tax=Ilumatobacter coccineus TaxID=467094 RepID=UPI00034BFA66|nr:hypothetical protein [Ilumatobacter coccineus]